MGYKKDKVEIAFYINKNTFQGITECAKKYHKNKQELYEIAISLFCDIVEEMINDGQI